MHNRCRLKRLQRVPLHHNSVKLINSNIKTINAETLCRCKQNIMLCDFKLI